ncbi:YbaK/EbsC family protein [Chloroflexi bacterium CFX2]|nr:YbaK/EbsC family protein [Chloroflexi bacterium CFX2]
MPVKIEAMEIPPVSLALEKLNIPHRVFRHETPVDSLEKAARDRGQRPSQVVRTLLFRLTEDEFALVLAAGPGQISWKLLRKILGRSRITMATEEEVLAVTGYKTGTVGPFGLARQARVLIEAGVLREEEVSIGSGLRDTAVILKTADLLKALGDAEVVELFENNS